VFEESIRGMPAQQLERGREKVAVMKMGGSLPANSSSAALVSAKTAEGTGLLQPEFRPASHAASGHITTRQWITVAVLVYVNLINYMDRLTLAGILEDVKREFNASDAMAGILQTAFIVSYMLFAPLFGYLGDRYSRKAIMAGGVFLWSIFTLIGSFMSGAEEHRGKGWGNPDFLAFLGCRAMVGIGEASYSTIAPTIISDMFVKDTRSKMLALFYFAIPVGSGLGYIVGSETAAFFGHWQWGLRATPVLGIVAVVLIILLLTDPPRGESEGHEDLQAGSYREDLAYLATNTSFILSTLGFTCVTFCTGALSWWGPIFIQRGLETQPEEERAMNPSSVPFVFGVVTMMSGVVGVPLGMVLSTKLKAKYPRADPIICGVGILISAVFLTLGMLLCESNIVATFAFIFIGEVSLNLNWSIVADILLYVVTPTCRSTAEAVQILLSHTFGDAGSPYLIGVISDGLFTTMVSGAATCRTIMQDMAVASSTEAAIINSMKMMEEENATESMVEELTLGSNSTSCDQSWEMYRSLQYSFFSNSGVEVIGGFLFLITAIFIVRDKLACELAVSEIKFESEQASRPMLKPTANLEMLASDEEEAPKLQLLDEQESSIESSRSVTPDV
jgi:MFS family permease